MGRVAGVLTGCALLAAMGAGGEAAEAVAGPVTPTRATPFDVDGDGIANLVIGVPGEDLGGLRDVGVVHVLRSARTGPTAEHGRMVSTASSGVAGEPHPGDAFGSVVASADFDADGYADVAVAMPSRGVSVLYGSQAGLSQDRSVFWQAADLGVPVQEFESVVGALAAG